jgi:hypothetical protein
MTVVDDGLFENRIVTAHRGFNPGKAGSGHALQKRLFGGLDRIGGSDMHPHAVEP